MMVIMTMLSPFDRSDHTAAFFYQRLSTISMYIIFTCAINAEISWRAETSEGSFGVIAQGAAVTVVFFCYTLVYVCKTEVHATIQFAFNSELSFSPTKGILRNYEAVFISKILFTVQFNYVCLSFSYFRLLFNCLLVIQLCSFVFQLCLLVVQLLYLIMPA